LKAMGTPSEFQTSISFIDNLDAQH
jgi:hypothetical protein